MKAIIRSVIALLTIGAAASQAHAVTAPLAVPPGRWVAGEVVVRLKAVRGRLPSHAAARAIAARHGKAAARPLLPERIRARGVHGPLDAVFVLDYGAGADVPGLAQRLAADPGVAYAEPNYIFQAAITPNDPYYGTTGTWGQSYPDMWGLYQVGLDPVGAGSGWDYETGQSDPVVVAVIDTGLDFSHEDIAGRIWVNADEIAGNGIDDDGNGYVDDVNGWDFANSDNAPDDGHGHGTHCSGTIAAATNNELGVAGISWGATIMPIKGLSDGGSGSTDGLANALIYAADNGAKVLSNSWRGLATTDPQTMHDACSYAASMGCLVVAAAGNEGTDLFPPYPAMYPEVLAVAATDPDDVRASFTNFGYFVDISAPGVDVLSLRAGSTDMYGDGTHIVGEHYYRASGTSMACPHVSGVAALLWAAHPAWTADQVRNQLCRTADDIEPLNDLYPGAVGTGRVNVRWALALAEGPLVRFREAAVEDAGAANPNQAADPGETVALVATLRNSWLPASAVAATLTTADSLVTVDDGAADYGGMAEGEVKSNTGDAFVISIDPSCPFGHTITFDLDIDADGHAWHDQFTLTVPAPELSARGYLVRDPYGDLDHELDAGETCWLIVRLANGEHSGVARNVGATIATTDGHLSIDRAAAAYPDLPAGEVGLNSAQPFSVTLDPAFPIDHIAQVEVTVAADGFSDVLDLELALPDIDREISDFVPIPPWYDVEPYDVNVEVDERDCLHAAWDHPDDALGAYMLAYREWDSGQWLPRQYLAGGSTGLWSVRMSLDPLGRPHLSWLESVWIDEWGFPLIAAGIYYRNGEDGWGGIDNVSNTPGTVENIRIYDSAVDPAGNAHVAWLFYRYDGGAFVDETIYHSRRVDGAWQPAVPIVVHTESQWYDEFELLPTSDGGLWLFYRFGSANPMLYYRTWDGVTWSGQVQVPTDGLPVSEFDAAIDSADNLHVVFVSQENPARMFHLEYRDGVWSGLTQFPDIAGALSVSLPRVHADRDDAAHLLWAVRTKPGDYYIDNIYTRRYDGQSWSAPEALTDFPPSPGRYLSDLAMAVDSVGRRHIVYIAYGIGVHHFVAPPAIDERRILTSDDDWLQPGWNLISLPAEQAVGDEHLTFAGIPIDDRLFRYDHAGGGYLMYTPLDPGLFGPVEAGIGYWLYLDEPARITYQAAPGPASPWVQSLPTPGWYLIGVPADHYITLGRVVIHNNAGGTGFAIGQAAAEHGWVDLPMYAYDQAGGGYLPVGPDPWAASAVMQPWRGYWLHTNVPDLSLRIYTD